MVFPILMAGVLAGGTAASFSTNGDPRLAAYIERALKANPAIEQAASRYRGALQRAPQVRALPDPMLGFTQFMRSPETRVGPQTTMLSISQQFPWFGKLGERAQVAAKEAEVSAQQVEAQRAEVVRQVKLAYYELSYLDRSIQITGEDLSVLEHYESLAQSRYAQGVGLQQAVIKLQAEMTRDQSRLEELRSRRVDAEVALNALLDQPVDTAVEPIELSPRPRVDLELEPLYQVGRRHRPELQAARLQIERDRRRVELAQKSYWPDFTLGASFTNVNQRSDPAGVLNPPDQNGKNIYAFTFGINLPIRRGRYDAAVQEASEDQAASSMGLQNAVNLVDAAIRAVGFKLRTLEDQIGLFEHTLQPQAEQALRSAEAAYSTGMVGVLDLLDSERVLLEVRLGLVRLQVDFLKALAEMERAIGAPFPEVSS